MPKRTDSNQREITEILRRAGAIVRDTSRLGRGFPDLTIQYHNIVFFIECKVGSNRLTKAEQEFYDEFKGHIFVVRCPEDVISILEWIDEDA